MEETLGFLLRHGYLVVFFWVAAEQLGLPLPSVPFLLAAGALAGAGQLNFLAVLLVGMAAAMLSDFSWYQVGRRGSGGVLNLVCRVSLEPDSCVRNTQNLFARYGARSLLLVKFVPGLSAAAAPLAGLFRLRWWRFLLFDGLGAAIWVGVYAGLGYAFSDQLELVARRALQLGAWLLVILLAALGAYLGWKYAQRRRFLHELRVARITPEELREKLQAGEEIAVVDLRHSVEFEVEGRKLPGALHFAPEELDRRHREIPRDRDVVLYCT